VAVGFDHRTTGNKPRVVNGKGEDTMPEVKEATVTCCKCGETQEYEDDGETFDCMPDGIITPDGWVCSDCLVDEDGDTLLEYR